MKKQHTIKELSFKFSLDIIKVFRILIEEKREFILSKQLMRSGTAVGALIRESERAESKRDFIHKLSIAQKEANESEYWIKLLCPSNYLNSTQIKTIEHQCLILNKMLAKSLITLRNKYSNN